jgi:hypothetical protein
LKRFHNKLKSSSKASKGVPIVRQWNKITDMNISHGSFEHTENMSGCAISGTEFLGEIRVISTIGTNPTSLGAVLYNLPLSPAFMPSTRIRQLMELFQIYAPALLAVHFIPVLQATQNGSVIAGVTFDPNFSMAEIPPGDQGARVWMSMEGFEMVNVYQPFSVIWCPTIQDGYWSRIDDTDARLTVPGNLVVSSASQYSPFDGIATDLPLFNIVLSYEIEFERRGLQIPRPITTLGEAQYNGTPVSDMFYIPPGGTYPGLEVCVDRNTAPLTNYAIPDYILLCTVQASTVTVGSTGWEAGGFGLLEFLTHGGDTFTMTQGTAFYMVFKSNGETGAACWMICSSLSSALERDADIYWGNTGLLPINILDATFDFQPVVLP